MRKFLKWLIIVVGGLVALVVVLVLVLVGITDYRLNKTYEVSVEPVPIPTDAESLERGRYLVTSVTPCQGCHGENLGGVFFLDDPSIGQIYSANLTAGAGGKGAVYSDEDWVRALRYGLDQEGKPIFMPPVVHFRFLSDEDLGAILAYVKTFPPVDGESPDIKLSLMAKVLFALGQFGKLPAEVAVASPPPPPAPARSATVEYGEYLTRVAACRDCHGEALVGQIAYPGGPMSANLTPGGELLVWTEADFLKAFRTGETPSGRFMSEEMPVDEYQMTDEDLTAVFLYLKSLPAGQPEQ